MDTTSKNTFFCKLSLKMFICLSILPATWTYHNQSYLKKIKNWRILISKDWKNYNFLYIKKININQNKFIYIKLQYAISKVSIIESIKNIIKS